MKSYVFKHETTIGTHETDEKWVLYKHPLLLRVGDTARQYPIAHHLQPSLPISWDSFQKVKGSTL